MNNVIIVYKTVKIQEAPTRVHVRRTIKNYN